MESGHEQNPLLRFSNRVGDYARYRPGYPPELIVWLRDAIDLRPAWIVADVGSGTGLLAREFTANGNLVYAVEPNPEMRTAAEAAFEREPHFASMAGSAEATGLPAGCVDLVSAGQAFHWFDRDAVQREWRRILCPGGRVLIVFNSRRIGATPFMGAYDRFLVERAVDYPGVDHRRVLGESLSSFFDGMQEWHHHFFQPQTWEELLGVAMSSSYVPAPGHPRHAAFVEGLKVLFDEHAINSHVEFAYETEAYTGWLA
ncbi:MAG TPA: class I SAM-dependent methyltransferase [Candidatus Krumholzibacteria bacterium]|nr:class I SAM-dependent methyltransferase [Candidatus Krumholzibacteria bacterium]